MEEGLISRGGRNLRLPLRFAPGRREPLRSLRIVHSARALFVGLSDGVLRFTGSQRVGHD